MRHRLKYFLVFLSIATGALFLYSAWTKVLPIQPFEYTMVEYLHFPWLLATLAARFMVGLEAALGGLMVLHLFGKQKWVLRVAFWLLVAFSVYLVWLWITAGDDVNCGCFGDAIWMSPSASLLKNGVLLAIVWLLQRYHHGIHFPRYNTITATLLAVGIALPFVLFPVTVSHPDWLKKGGYKIDLAPLYHPVRDTVATDTLKTVSYPAVPSMDLTKGKHIIAFLSPTCEHCRIAARKMSLMRAENKELPFFMIIGGVASDLTEFWKVTKAQNIPYMRLHRDPFLQYTQGMFPLILWVDNGTVVAKSTYNTLSQQAVEQWLKQGDALIQ